MSEEPKVLYVAKVQVTGGRAGEATSLTGELNLKLARPAERGTGAGTDPEELFAAGYAACFDNSLVSAARRERVKLGPTTTTASVALQATPDQRYSIGVELEVHAPDCSTEDLDRVIAVAHTLCPYSNALRGNVGVKILAKGSESSQA